MINHLRIDNRLIHGQVAVVWKAYVNARVLIVCNDEVAHDPIQKTALPLAMQGSRVLVLTVDELLEYDRNNPNETKFVICKHPYDCLELLRKGADIDVINVGNAAPLPNTDYVMITKSISCTAKEAEEYREIARLHGNHLETQMVPSYEKQDFLELLNRKYKGI